MTISHEQSSAIYDQIRELGLLGGAPSSQMRLQFQTAGAAAARASMTLEETMSYALQALLPENDSVDRAHEEFLSGALAAIAAGYSSAQLARFPVGQVRDTIDSPLISRLNALHRISRAATITTSSTEYLRQSVQSIIEVTGANAVTVFGFDRPTNSLTLVGQHGFDPALTGTMSIRGDRGITGRAMQTGKAVFAEDVASHPDWIVSPTLQDGRYRSQATLPMRLSNPDRLVGVISLWWNDPRSFDEDERVFLKDIAAELAIGVEYTQLHSLTDERLRRKIIELGTLQRVSRTVASALDLNDVLRFVSESAVELTNAESAAVFRLPSPGKDEPSSPLVEYRVGAARQVSDQSSRDALLSDVINSGSARAVDMDYVDGSNILYCMPLSSARERWGALCVRLKSGMEVTEDDLALLQAFTDTASIAIENAELYEEARRSAETASTLLQEMHHRVRNNLQTVAALLSLQLRQVEGSEAERHLQDAIGRVQAIASVHDLLSDETRLSGATIDSIARLVADELKVTLIPPTMSVMFEIEPTDVVVPTRQATVLALLFNELISNSIEHGFAGLERGRIVIRTWRSGDLVTIEVMNDGQKLPAEFDPNANSGIGLRIIQRMVESDLKGEFTIEQRDDTTVARMTFPGLN
ncbi:MAG: GAF domain-containing protein [Thermomicrobiales bacterium]|nr:GAF domain-containing protein [Thermomicrobiales bacterium]MCO5222482.1 GAF domain-containing protein [Thermomicrobiales bacterium]